MKLLKRKWFKKLSVLVGFAIVIFLYLQLFSFGLLNFYFKQTQLPHASENVVKARPPLQKAQDIVISTMISSPQLHVSKTAKAVAFVRGSDPRHRDNYLPQDGYFTCLSGQPLKRIPFAQVNDDYCDCADGSDEPGTSACENSRFFCSFQLGHGLLVSVSSSRVRDGVCDCCDGSDEDQNTLLPAKLRFNSDKQTKLGVFQAPCSNQCADLDKQDRMKRRKHEAGLVKKKAYAEFALGKPNPDNMYGIDGVFLKLSENCLRRSATKFTYKLCLFKEAYQQVFPEAQKVIGRSGKWEKFEKDNYVLIMADGDSTQCPRGKSRTTIVNLKCGDHDELLNVNEENLCVYVMDVITPAAC